MKKLLIFCCILPFICLSQSITSEIFQPPSNTGANMTIGINISEFDQFEGGQIGAFYDLNQDGILECVALEQIYQGFFGLALWGDDSSTPEKDGLNSGDIPVFAIFHEGNIINFETNFEGYITNAISNLSIDQLIISITGCEDSNFLEFYTYNNNIDYENITFDIENNCITPVSSGNLSLEDFYQPSNTGANMTIGVFSSSFDQFEAGQIGAFYDLNEDGFLECVGLEQISQGFFGLAIWGDDSSTPEKDGLSSGDVPLFAINYNGGVFIIQETPSFTGYVTNGIVNITEFSFQIPAGCTDPLAFNYNPYAFEDDGSCIPVIEGCTDITMYNYNSIANTEDGSCIPYIFGCIDESACNNDGNANTDDESCIYPADYPDNIYNCEGLCINDSNGNGVCDEVEPTISVNTDPLFYSIFVGDTLSDSIAICNDGQGVLSGQIGSEVFSLSSNINNSSEFQLIGTEFYGTYNATGSVYLDGLIYFINYNAYALNIYDPTSGSISTAFSLHNDPYGIIYDGNSFWIGDYSGQIFQYNLDGNIMSSFQAPFFNYPSISYDGEFLYLSESFNNGDIYKIDFSGNIINSFSNNNLFQNGLYQLYYNTVNQTHYAISSDFDNTYLYSFSLDENIEVNETFETSYDDEYYSIFFDGVNLNLLGFGGSKKSISIPSNASECSVFQLDLNSENLDVGFYQDNIIIESNDPENPILTIPYEIEVIDEIYGCQDSLGCNFNSLATIDDGSCVYPGCLDNNFIEYYNQGYSAGCDDGSCSIATENFGINADQFIEPYNSGSSMNLVFDLDSINGLEGSIMGIFYDLNGDGVINSEIYFDDNGIEYSECIGLVQVTEDMFSVGIWGDDTTTDQIDGIPNGATDVIFTILTQEGVTLAFNIDPEFQGYETNSIYMVNNLDFDVMIYGCSDPEYCNYSSDVNFDDGTCEGYPGCTNNLYMEYDSLAACTLDNACLTSWQSAYFEMEDNLNQTNIILDSTISEYEDSINYLESEYELLASVLNECNQNVSYLNNQMDSMMSPVMVDLYAGWNMIGYTLLEPQNVVATFDDIIESIYLVKNNDAEVYWPEFGFDNINNFQPGQGYQIKVLEDIYNYTYPIIGDIRIELTPTVPQWVIDMEVEMHPNDIRTLVRVVNLLGQEVNPEMEPRGSVLLYLYNDATVEKKLVE